MNRLTYVAAFAMLCAASFNGMAADPAPDAAAQAAMMEKFKPGKEHEALAKRAGSYDVAAKMWMEPGKPAQESKGSAVYTVTGGGRWLKSEYKGEMMGQPFTGTGYEGYDRVANKYISTWMDDMSTQMMYATGSSKDGGKTVEYTSEMADCMGSGKMIKFRNVVKEESADKFTFEMYETRDGKENKSMELTYTRKK